MFTQCTECLGLAGLSIIITKLCLCFVYFEPNLFLSGAVLSHLFVHIKMLLHSSLNYLGSTALFLLHTNFSIDHPGPGSISFFA